MTNPDARYEVRSGSRQHPGELLAAFVEDDPAALRAGGPATAALRYYHAGIEVGGPHGTVVWSDHTRRTWQTAAREACRMARGRQGARPLVEWWDRAAGLRPGWDATQGAEYVDEVAS